MSIFKVVDLKKNRMYLMSEVESMIIAAFAEVETSMKNSFDQLPGINKDLCFNRFRIHSYETFFLDRTNSPWEAFISSTPQVATTEISPDETYFYVPEC